MTSLLPAILAHFLVDRTFKTEPMRAAKSAMTDWAVYARHGLLVFAAMWVALGWQTGNVWRAMSCAATIAVAHLCVDWGKYLALRWREHLRRTLAWLFSGCHEVIPELLTLLCAQALHLIVLDGLTGLFFPPRYELTTVISWVNGHLLGSVPIGIEDRILYLFILLLLNTFGVARVMQFVERAFNPGEIQDVTVKNVWEMTSNALTGTAGGDVNHRHVRTEERLPSPPEKPGVSYWVGILERLVITLSPLGLGVTVTAVLAVKSIARYSQFKHRAFVEYFIVGTLMSIACGVVFAWLAQRAVLLK